jgi:hypothetical protein
VPKEFAVALVNRILEHGRRRITVRYPLYNHDLFAFDETFTITKATTYDAFTDARKDATSYDRESEREAPVWGDLAECLASAGVVRPTNLVEFAHWAEDRLEEQGKPELKARPLFLAIDTNIAYRRQLSRKFPLEGRHRRIEATDFQYAISAIVRGEIDGAIQRKYRGELRRVFTKPWQQDYLRDLAHRNALPVRKAKLAQNELNFLGGGLNALSVPGEAPSGDHETRDIQIARSYGAFSRKQNADVALLTMDQNMVDHAQNARVRCFALKVPRIDDLRGLELHHTLAALLHDLAVTFGVLEIQPFHIRVLGEWGGKTAEDYSSENIRIQLPEGVQGLSLVERDFSLSAQLSDAPAVSRS